MTLNYVSVATLLASALTLAFLSAGVANLFGSTAIKDDFTRWGYPRWWNLVTGALEMLVAAFIAIPTCRLFGLWLGGAICAAAVATLIRHRDFSHLPLGIVLTALSATDLALIAA